MPRTPVAAVLILLVLLSAPAAAHAAAPVNMTAPSLVGVAREKQALTIDDGVWSPAPPASKLTYRWLRCDAAGRECVTQSATAKTYTLLAADVGSTMRAVVTAATAEGSTQATTAATDVVTGDVPVNTVAPAITGNLRDGQTLTAVKGSWQGTLPQSYAYEWRRCDGGGSNCSAIAPASGTATYRLTSADVAATIRLRVIAANVPGTTDATSAPTGVIGPPAPPVNSAGPTVALVPAGTPKDTTKLTVGTGTWTGASPMAYAYQWQRCTALGTGCLSIAGAGGTAAAYTAGVADIGSTLRAVVTATNPDGQASVSTAPTAVVTANPPTSTAAPAVSGAARVGQTLTATTGTFSGTAPLAYTRQWWRCDVNGQGCQAIAGETAASHVLVDADLDHTIKVAVTATNDAGGATGTSTATAVVGVAQPPVNTVPPTATGASLVDGQNVTGTNGTWTGAASLVPKQVWQRCDAAGANCADTATTGLTYKLSAADVGRTLRIAVTMTNPDGVATAVSAVTGVIAPLAPRNTAPPGISGTAKDLQVLTAGSGTWNGTTPLAYDYQWQRCDSAGNACTDVPGATATTFTLSGADIGLTMRVRVRAANDAGGVSATSGPTGIVAGMPPKNTVAPAIAGTARDALTLTVSSGTWTGTSPIAHAYQWRRCATTNPSSCKDVAGATGASYELTPADVGNRMLVIVSASNAAGAVTQTTSQTDAVRPAPPVSTAVPALTGTARDGLQLAASPGTWTGTPTIALTYRWERCDPLAACTAIPNATGQTYTLTSADVGLDVRVAVTALNNAGTATASSAGSGTVAPWAPEATALPAISGTPRDGSTLTATTGTWNGTRPMTTTVQWRRCDAAGDACADVPGATAGTYELTAADAGTTLRVRVTAGNAGGSTDATSGFTPVIAPLAPSNTVSPSISGVARDGRRLTTDTGDWLGTPPLELAYQWRRCDAKGTACADIDGAASRDYVARTADVGSTLRVVVKATNGGGTAAVTTPATGVVQPNPPVNLTPPTITGRVMDGEQLEAVDGTWTGVVTIGLDHRWWRCDTAGHNCGIIAGATESAYRVTSLDVGLTLKVEVIARNAGGATSAFSDASPVGEPSAPINTKKPELKGRHGVGELMEASRGTWVGSPTLRYAYQWLRCDADGGDCAAIPGADADGYRLTSDDDEHTVRARVTVSNGAGGTDAVSDPSPLIGDDPPVRVELPSIDGSPVAESVKLTARPGSWTGATPMQPSWQWRRCDPYGGGCADLDAATGASYVPVAADVGFTLRVVVTMDNGIGATAATSPPSPIVKPAPPTATEPPTVTASGLKPGASLTGRGGAWAGADPITFEYQWLRCEPDGETCRPVPDATALKYPVTSSDIGKLLRLRVTATNPTGPTVARSAVVGPITALAPTTAGKPKVTVDGKPRIGGVLRVDTGVWTGTEPLVFSYRWQACVSTSDCRDIDGATTTERILTDADVGLKLRVVVTATGPGGTTSAESAATDTVAGLAPVAGTTPDAAPAVEGTPADGRTLTADPGTWSGTGPFEYAYAWQRCEGATCKPVANATGPSYVLGAEDVGKRMAVKVTSKNAYGKTDAVSAQTEAVSARKPRNRRLPTVSKLPALLEAGTKLRGRPGRWAGSAPIDFTYQWLRCSRYGDQCRMLKGATEALYVLTRRDLRGPRLRYALRLAVTGTNPAGERTALSRPLGARRKPPEARVRFSVAVLQRPSVTLSVTCAAGSAPCAGTVVVGPRRAQVAIAAGQFQALSVKAWKRVRKQVAVSFIPADKASGRSLASTVRVKRANAPAPAATPG